MKCSSQTKSLIRFKKHGHFLIQEVTIYFNEEYPLFGITKVSGANRWAVVHRPSERTIASCFNKKQEAEQYLDYLLERTDLNSLLLCNPNFEYVTNEIVYDVEIAYKKFYSEVRMRK